MIQIRSSQTTLEGAGLKAMIYGPSGVGKTMLAATSPGAILIDAEAGMLSLSKPNIERLYGISTPGISYNIPVISVKDMTGLQEVNQWLYSSQEAMQFQTVFIDSLSEIAEQVLVNCKRSAKDPRQAYGDLLDKMELIIRSFRDLPGKNVVIICKQELHKTDSGLTFLIPSMPGGKLGMKLPYFFDLSLRMFVNKDGKGNTFRALQTQPDLMADCKDRTGLLDPIERPHIGYLLSKIYGQSHS